IAWVRSKFCELPGDVIKFVVTHHPFDLPQGHRASDIVGRAPLAIKGLAECGADAFLAGHMHISHTGHTAERYKIPGHSALVIQAGTAASTRGRGEANSFNLIRVNGLKITIERQQWQPQTKKFEPVLSESFHKETAAWIPD